jgi:ribose 1,5-bisphosphate isomerase
MLQTRAAGFSPFAGVGCKPTGHAQNKTGELIMPGDGTEKPTLPSLPASAQTIVDQLQSGKFLGASRNIRMINDLFCAIADDWETSDAEALINAIHRTGEYFAVTRGINTPCIGNAIRFVLRSLTPEEASTVQAVRELMNARRANYNAQSLRNQQLMAEYGANLLSNVNAILPFDYSSTVQAILRKLAENGCKKRLIVPESRVLDGGRPIAREATAMGHSVVFIVDMAFSHFLREVDALLIGAESFMANGDCWNTIGSYPIAAMAHRLNIPTYVPTELIKIDPLSFTGFQKVIKPLDYSRVLDYPASFEHPELVSVTAPDLDNVPSSLIAGYITPVGVLLPQHVRSEAKAFLQSIGISTP